MNVVVMILLIIGLYWLFTRRKVSQRDAGHLPLSVECKLDSVVGWQGVVTLHQTLTRTSTGLQRLVDRQHPRSLEIIEHTVALCQLRGLEGPRVERERARLQKGLDDIRNTAHRQKLIDDAAYLRSIQPQIDAVHALRHVGNKAHLDARARHYRQLEAME